MKEYIKKPLLIMLIALSTFALIWLTYILVGHSLIESIYHGKSFGFLNKIISGQDAYSLDYYINKGHRYMLFYSVLCLLTVIFSLPIISIFLIWKEHGKHISPSKIYLGLAMVLLLWFSWSALSFSPASYSFETDYWEHTATLKEWSSNLWSPKNPHLAVETESPRFIPIFFLLALISHIFHLTPIQAMGIFGILNIALLLGGIFLFFRIYFDNDWAPAVGLIILFSGWGIGYLWSGLYQLRSLFFIISYPSLFVFALSFYLFWLALKILHRESFSLWTYILVGFLSALIFLSHPVFSALAIGSFFILIFTRSEIPFMKKTQLAIPVLAGLLATELWPYYSLRQLYLIVFFGEMKWSFQSGYYIYLFRPINILIVLGPSLLAIPLVLYFIIKRRHLFIAAGFIVMIFPFALNLFYPLPDPTKFLIFAVFYLHLALTWGVLQLRHKLQTISQQSLSIKIKQGILLWLLALFFGWNVTLTAMEFAGYHISPSLDLPQRYSNFQPVVSDMKKLSCFIPEETVVLAPLEISWPLPTFSGRVTGLYHSNPFIHDDSQRRSDNMIFFLNETSLNERKRILKQYGVTHVIYEESHTPDQAIDNIKKMGRIIGKVKDYRVVQLFSFKGKDKFELKINNIK